MRTHKGEEGGNRDSLRSSLFTQAPAQLGQGHQSHSSSILPPPSGFAFPSLVTRVYDWL